MLEADQRQRCTVGVTKPTVGEADAVGGRDRLVRRGEYGLAWGDEVAHSVTPLARVGKALGGKGRPARRARRPSRRSAQRPESRSNLFGEDLRLLPRSEVTAFGNLVEIDEVVVVELGP